MTGTELVPAATSPPTASPFQGAAVVRGRGRLRRSSWRATPCSGVLCLAMGVGCRTQAERFGAQGLGHRCLGIACGVLAAWGVAFGLREHGVRRGAHVGVGIAVSGAHVEAAGERARHLARGGGLRRRARWWMDAVCACRHAGCGLAEAMLQRCSRRRRAPMREAVIEAELALAARDARVREHLAVRLRRLGAA